MSYGLVLVTPPAEEPVSLAQLKTHLRLDGGTDEDADLAQKIAAAREQLETDTRRQFVTATRRLVLNCFPRGDAPILLPCPPLASVTSVRYRSAVDGSWITMDADDYVASASRTPGRIFPAYGESWPLVRSQSDSVEIEYECGYGAAADVPQKAKQAILLLAGHWYLNREAVAAGGSAPVLPLGYDAVVRQLDPMLDLLPIGD